MASSSDSIRLTRLVEHPKPPSPASKVIEPAPTGVSNPEPALSDKITFDIPEVLELFKNKIDEQLATRKAEFKERFPNSPKEYQEIEDSLDNDGIEPGAPWGFVLFRTVYGPDTDEPFAHVVGELCDIKESLEDHEQGHLFPRHELTIIEDETSFAGADSHTVRDAFRTWVAEDLTPRLKNKERWGGEKQVRTKPCSDDDHSGGEHPIATLPTRWIYCLFVDEACIRSLKDPADSRGPRVKILTTDWRGERTSTVAEGWEDGETDDECEEVGWMYMSVYDYMELYNCLMYGYWWEEIYQRAHKGRFEGHQMPFPEEALAGARDAGLQDTEIVAAEWWKEYRPR
jgi:hypothetical protein